MTRTTMSRLRAAAGAALIPMLVRRLPGAGPAAAAAAAAARQGARGAALAALAALGAALAAAPARAQCSGATSPTTYAPSSMPFPTPSANDFNVGWIEYSTQLSISVQAGSVNLCVAANTPTMGVSTDGSYQKPIADVQIEVPAGSGSWVSLTQTQTLVYHLKAKNPTILANVRIRLSSADIQGTYNTGLVVYPYK